MPAVLTRPIFVSHGYINIFTFLSHLNNLYKDFIFLHISERRHAIAAGTSLQGGGGGI